MLIFLHIFLQPSFTFSPSAPNVPYFVRSTAHSHFFSGTEHDPHLYETSKCIIAYNLVFKFLGSGEKDKGFRVTCFWNCLNYYPFTTIVYVLRFSHLQEKCLHWHTFVLHFNWVTRTLMIYGSGSTPPGVHNLAITSRKVTCFTLREPDTLIISFD
jgi:hypothetical protein